MLTFAFKIYTESILCRSVGLLSSSGQIYNDDYFSFPALSICRLSSAMMSQYFETRIP